MIRDQTKNLNFQNSKMHNKTKEILTFTTLVTFSRQIGHSLFKNDVLLHSIQQHIYLFFENIKIKILNFKFSVGFFFFL